MPAWPIKLYNSAGGRQLDALESSDYQLSGEMLMVRAAQAAWRCMQQNWPLARTLTIFCGPGKNGGDGHCLASIALSHGYTVHLVTLDETEDGCIEALERADLVVDALLGTGISRPVDGKLYQFISHINRYPGPILSLDNPSGLSVDTGQSFGIAVIATATITFLSLKPGLFTGMAPDYVGQLFFDDLQVPQALYDKVAPIAMRMDWDMLPRLLPRRRTLHKGQAGHVLIIGGAPGMRGAVALAGEAALRVGAGRVSILTHPEHAAMLGEHRPELMVHALHDVSCLVTWKGKVDVIVLGPGLGRSHWGQAIFSMLQGWDIPMVYDADALHWLAENPDISAHRIITPHPKEAAGLLGWSLETVQADRLQAAQALHQQYGGVVVLKGAGTLVQGDQILPVICTGGNPGMATAGMGDVLSGVIAGLWAQGWTMQAAACEGVALHAHAGDSAMVEGERGMIASDLFPFLRRSLRDREILADVSEGIIE